MAAVSNIYGRQILDSRGNPTVEVEVTLKDGAFGRAAVPSGASTGTREALELRDGESSYLGKAVTKAVGFVNQELSEALVGKDFDQSSLDQTMIDLDGTANKEKFGANAILGISLAFAVANANSKHIPVYEYVANLANNDQLIMPRPMFNILNGGAHADWATDIQEYMIMPMQDLPYSQRLQMSAEVFHHLGKIVKKKGYNTNVGNEGGYAPQVKSNAEAFELILEAIAAAGYTVGEGKDFLLAIDAAASEFYQDGKYQLRRDGSTKNSDEMIEWLKKLTEAYPLMSLEDPLAEGDWKGWSKLTAKLGSDHQIVGDDLLVTNTKYIERAIKEKSCNSVLIKLNQIGTLTETIEAINLTQAQGWTAVPSHRSGETEDVFLAHLAVGTGAGQIKTGSPSRTDRTAKYNELLRIAEKVEAQV